MPYITKERRGTIDCRLHLFTDYIHDLSAGDLNYIFSKIVWSEFDKNPNYAKANELMGMLQGVQAEFYRRKVAPYEDEKLKENGDIE